MCNYDFYQDEVHRLKLLKIYRDGHREVSEGCLMLADH